MGRRRDTEEPMDEDRQIDSISGRAVLLDGTRTVKIGISSGSIAYVEDISSNETLDTVIFPGFMDIHVHAREYPMPPRENSSDSSAWEAACRKETFLSAGKAAINGGVTLFAAMPNDPSPPDGPQSYKKKIEISSSAPCPVLLFAAVTATSEPWDDLPYKVYLDPKPSRFSFNKWTDLRNVLARYSGCRVFFHAEDPDLIEKLGSQGPRWKTRPPDAEMAAVDRLLELTEKYGLMSHICHVSTEMAVSLITDYNRHSSEPVSCEVSPHHLFFSISDEGVLGAGKPVDIPSELFECNPPLRSERDRRFMLHALKHGLVDVLASDHAPHSLEEKKKGAPGMPHLDTLGPFAGWLIRDGGYSHARISEILAAAPARIMSKYLDQPRGSIKNTFSASFSVLDLSRSTLVDGSQITDRGPLETLCKWSPFSGTPLPAFVVKTVINGKEYEF
ncbi:MAG: hypothetical protein WCG29_06345 [Desulfomonile sp.]|jgi:dihydroorotase|nr:amidohydrolase family protein [Deltaproteobacteria bacterium]